MARPWLTSQDHERTSGPCCSKSRHNTGQIHLNLTTSIMANSFNEKLDDADKCKI